MCGIVGLTDKENYHLLSTMNELLAHRGPNDSGSFVDRDNGVALAMRRLSIIDLEGGKQPIANENESLWVVCNGEIYNSPELRQQLTAGGHRLRTKNSDVETLLHLYEDKGADLLNDLNGMFAFVIYDKRKNILFGARDRIGIKPFYYSARGGKFAFASELKSLLLLPWVGKETDFDSLYHYISLQFVPAPGSVFSDIRKLPAGHFFIYDLSKKNLIIKKYWELDVSHVEDRSADEWKELVSAKLKEAVKLWTLSDVPIACSLSGGLDSSAVVGILSGADIGQIKTYSLGFEGEEEQGCNELPLAGKVAEKWGAEHHKIVLKPEKVMEDLQRMVWHLDEPYAGGLPSWYIYELIGKDVKVALTGTGGDELFGNYGKYRIYERSRMYHFLKPIKDSITSFSSRAIKNGYNYPAGHFYPSYFSDAFKDSFVFNGNFKTTIKTESLIENIWEQSGTDDPRNSVAYVDFKLQLPEEFLHVTDRFSMAHSVEARVPFLDHSLVELVFRIPPSIRTGGNEPKSFFRQVVKDLLPEELLAAPKKGFVLPLQSWTRKELRPLIEETLSASHLRRQGIFSAKLYDRIVEPHLQFKRDYTQQVWTLFMFQMWYKSFIRE